ncbi:MAG: hypothetical protein ACJ8AH_11780 [Stellaceae bacterium]
MTEPSEGWTRVAAILSFPDTPGFTETYGFAGASGKVWLEGQYLIPRERLSKTLYLFMHPSSTLHLLPMPAALVGAGLHVLCAASRYPKNDSSLIIEKVAIDMGAWVKDARVRGYEKVILVGWSGGGSLSLFYQAEAEAPSVTATPAGDAVDLTRAGLEPADGVIFIAAHLSRAGTLTEWLDPSVTDELDPDRRELEFDIYDRACPHQPPYSDEFITRFRVTQIARNRKITGWCQEWLDTLRRRGTSEVERCFVVHRTMCDVRWLDPCIDPDGRQLGWCYLGDPRTANTSPVGLARYSSLRSWLSQWITICRMRKGRRTRRASAARRYYRSRTKQMMPCPPRTIRQSAQPSRHQTRNISGSKARPIIIRTSLLSCTNASMRYWIGATAKDCLQTDHSPGVSWR